MRPPAATVAACLTLLGSAVHADGPALTAQDAWIRAVPGAEVAAVYLTLHNAGTNPLVIVGVSSPRATQAVIHETGITAGRSTMRPRERITIEPGATVRLAPGGLHIMLHVPRALTPGETVPITLRLEGGGELTVTARVRALGAD